MSQLNRFNTFIAGVIALAQSSAPLHAQSCPNGEPLIFIEHVATESGLKYPRFKDPTSGISSFLEDITQTYSADAIDAVAEILCALDSVENDRYRSSLQRHILVTLVSPDIRRFKLSYERFDKAGITPPDDAMRVLKTEILIQQASREARNAELRASVDAQEIRIQALRAQLEKVKENLHHAKVRLARLQEKSAELRAKSAEARAKSAELRAKIRRLDALHERILQNITLIKEAGQARAQE